MIDSIDTWRHLPPASYGKNKRGQKDGTGPYKGSSERKSGGKGKGPCKGDRSK